ncbi:unnamed protein product [Sphagnum troendelagicum]|uniref:YbaK/aminoacyl-tRNA synthetase-associated domain-containing protein n=1 Tax=Sphagnum troendelagicum TaxID=128251 RepID=A0ABP0TRZ5_9BRYO
MRAFTLNKGLKPPSQNPFAVVLDIAVRLTPEEKSNRLTGFENNAVTPIGMRTDNPVILSDTIVKLKPDYFWLGGGKMDLKLVINTPDFTQIVKPFITDCTYSSDNTTIC